MTVPRKLSTMYQMGDTVWVRYGGRWLDAIVAKVGRAYLTLIAYDHMTITLKAENVRPRNRRARGADKPEEAA